MNYLVGLFLAPDFKKMINWLNLKSEDVTLEETALETPTLRNFIILTALKIQQLKGELKETKELNQTLSKQHQEWRENELEHEIKLNILKETYEKTILDLRTENKPIVREIVKSTHTSAQSNLLKKQSKNSSVEINNGCSRE